jgi:hypothetical protein
MCRLGQWGRFGVALGSHVAFRTRFGIGIYGVWGLGFMGLGLGFALGVLLGPLHRSTRSHARSSRTRTRTHTHGPGDTTYVVDALSEGGSALAVPNLK